MATIVKAPSPYVDKNGATLGGVELERRMKEREERLSNGNLENMPMYQSDLIRKNSAGAGKTVSEGTGSDGSNGGYTYGQILSYGDRPVYSGTWDQATADAYDAIVNREKFSYNLNDDQLYQQYRDKYMQQGKLAMKDTMGQAAALTGGYGSSYGQAVGQQAYDASLQNLNDIVPELYSQAYGMYQDEGDRMVQNYQMLRDLSDDEYGKYRDSLSDWENERAWQTERADIERDRAYEDAAIKASYGDFSGYSDLFGPERAEQMLKVWKAGNYDLAYKSGMITAKEYKAMTGSWPPGYKKSSGKGTTNISNTPKVDDLEAQYQNAVNNAAAGIDRIRNGNNEVVLPVSKGTVSKTSTLPAASTKKTVLNKEWVNR